MKKEAGFVFWMLLLVYCPNGFSQTYNIKEFGAVPDGKTLCTKAVQSAIDKAFDNGGGDVVVPAGIFYTGTVFLKSNVYLRLLPGSVLQGSANPADYPEHNIARHKKFGTITHNGLYVEYMKAVVMADSARYTGITGEGAIRGAGEEQVFQLGINKDGKPKNIFFIGCTNVVLKGISVFNAAQVTVSISGCEKVVVDGIYIKSLVNWNCDGIDIDAKDVTVSNCSIDSEDDALCFKSEYLNRFCENVAVTNCVVSSLCNGIKLGTGSRTGFRNVTVDNCVIKISPFNGYRHWQMTPALVDRPEVQSVNCGIVILCVDGGLVENIRFSNIVMTDVLSPLFIKVNRRFLAPGGKPSAMRNISVQNITAHTRSILPTIIAGLEESKVEDVRLSAIRISIPIAEGADSLKTYPALIPEDVKGYPENRLTFGLKIPASAFYIRHAKRISLKDIQVTYASADLRPVVYLDDAKDIKLQELVIDGKKFTRTKVGLVEKNSFPVTMLD